jgi:hypothetical protein
MEIYQLLGVAHLHFISSVSLCENEVIIVFISESYCEKCFNVIMFKYAVITIGAVIINLFQLSSYYMSKHELHNRISLSSDHTDHAHTHTHIHTHTHTS